MAKEASPPPPPLKLLYIAFRYTRPVLQSTLHLMGCKPRHAFKVPLFLPAYSPLSCSLLRVILLAFLLPFFKLGLLP